MNKFRLIQKICQEKTLPPGFDEGNLGEDENFDAGYAQGQHELAQQILKEIYDLVGDPE